MHVKMSDHPATSIAVKQGRITLIWPLTLHMKDPPKEGAVVENTAMGFAADLEKSFPNAKKSGETGSCWVPVPDPIEHIAQPEREDDETETAFQHRKMSWENDAYAEAVYFHEFIQAFLYRMPECSDQAPFKLFRRSDIRHARFRFHKIHDKLVDIERINLYIFRTGVAVFTMDLVIPMTDEASATSGWTLAEFQTFHDLVRRAYAPYFSIENAHRTNGGLVLDSVQWLDGDKRLMTGANGRGWIFDLAGELDAPPRYVGAGGHASRRYPPLFEHWRVLLSPDLPLADYCEHRTPNSIGDGSAAAARWHHVVDERMATLATVSVTDAEGGQGRYKQISDGDMVRLCFADSSGTNPFPYDQGFLADFDARFAYDRFRSAGTRFLISGYSFVAVIGDSLPDTIIPIHMRRHYFQMMLLAQMEMASLLGFSGQVSRAVQRYGSGSENRLALERCMAAIQEEFLQFVHRFRFTGVSNQLQAQELFDMLRTNLRTQALFADVQEEISVANDFLRAEASDRATKSAEWLSLVGGFGVVIGVIIGLLGMNFLADEGIWRSLIGKGPLMSDLLAVSAVTGGVGTAAAIALRAWRSRLPRTALKPFMLMCLLCVALGTPALLVAISRFFP